LGSRVLRGDRGGGRLQVGRAGRLPVLLVGRKARVGLGEHGHGVLGDAHEQRPAGAAHQRDRRVVLRLDVGLEAVEAEAAPEEPRLVRITIAFRLVATGARERLGLALELER
jgi:hypothetical protein